MDETLEDILNLFVVAAKKVDSIDTKSLKDRHYTLGELYDHRRVLFNILCHTYPELSWKAKNHRSDAMFNGDFIAGITTPMGNVSYHFKLPFYDQFDVLELRSAPVYDGYTPDEALDRLISLPLLGKDYIQTEKSVVSSLMHEADISFQSESIDAKRLLAYHLNEITSILRDNGTLDLNLLGDGHHSFADLYRQKRKLFALICQDYPDLAWKSKSDIFGQLESEDKFLVGLNTPLGPTGYVLDDRYFDEFEVETLERAPISKDEVHQNVLPKLASVKIRQFKKKYK